MRFMLPLLAATSLTAAPLDTLILGSRESEKAHVFQSDRSEVVKGALGESARRLLPLEPATWFGGKMSFQLKIDPEKQNYLTVRLWGSETNHNLLVLSLEGKQLGYRHLGDHDLLDLGTDRPAYNGRFHYKTVPLPLSLTRGKTTANLEVLSNGPIWGYGKDFDEYQKPMTEPGREIHRIYSHTDPCFEPPAGEKQGVAPEEKVRTSPGAEVMAAIKKRVSDDLSRTLKATTPPNQMQTLFLARARHVSWTPAATSQQTVPRVLAGLDQLYTSYLKNPKLAQAEPSTWNPDWFGLGPAGQAISLLDAELKPHLETTLDDGKGGRITRRAAYTAMLLDCRDWHRANRRQYTNQSMINDLYGIYLANRGIVVLEPAKALPEKQALRYLRESVGLDPWLGSEVDGKPTRPLGDHFYQLTPKGLTRELGFVGNYGEVTDWVTQIYDATRPAPDQPGDPDLKSQLVRIVKARAPFRYPMPDEDGFRAMVQETPVGWRDTHFPGNVSYAQRPSRDGSPVEAAAATLDPVLVGYCQQMIADGQLFASIARQAEEGGLRPTMGLLAIPDQYELIRKQSASPHRLPMTSGGPDFVFTDETDGVVAIKHGDEVLYASLYWRARHAVNFLARVHYLTPETDRVAVAKVETRFTPSGMEYKRPDWINFGFANGGPRYPVKTASAHAGEMLPIAKIPDGIAFKPGQENLHAGRGDFYELRYGPYFIAMNMSEDKTFGTKVPEGGAVELVSRGTNLKPGSSVSVKPRTTVVFRTGK